MLWLYWHWWRKGGVKDRLVYLWYEWYWPIWAFLFILTTSLLFDLQGLFACR